MKRINKALKPLGIRLARHDYRPGENGIGRVYFLVDLESGKQLGEEFRGRLSDLTLKQWVAFASEHAKTA